MFWSVTQYFLTKHFFSLTYFYLGNLPTSGWYWGTPNENLLRAPPPHPKKSLERPCFGACFLLWSAFGWTFSWHEGSSFLGGALPLWALPSPFLRARACAGSGSVTSVRTRSWLLWRWRRGRQKRNMIHGKPPRSSAIASRLWPRL